MIDVNTTSLKVIRVFYRKMKLTDFIQITQQSSAAQCAVSDSISKVAC